MLYEIEGKVTEKDYYEFNKYHLKHSPDMKKRALNLRLSVPVTFILILMYYWARGYEWEILLYGLKYFSIISIIWFFLFNPFMILLLKLRFRINKNMMGIWCKQARLEFYEDYFLEITDNSKTERKYSAIYKVGINGNKAIYIFSNPAIANLIVFDESTSDEFRNKFIEFITQKAENRIF